MSPQELPSYPNHAMTRRRFLQLTAAGLALTLGLEFSSSVDQEPGVPVVEHVSLEKKEIAESTDLLRSGQWQYMAGAHAAKDGLAVAPTGLSIVNKRENYRIDPDPPLNMFGTRLSTEGDFSVSTRIESKTPVAFQIYGQVPLRFDDFRYERSRVECTNNGDTLTVRIWDGSSQQPSVEQKFQFEGSVTERNLEIRRIGSQLAFSMNGKPLGVIQKGSVFNSGEVWFGINSEQGQARVSDLTAKPLNGHKLAMVDTTSMRIARPLPEGLQTLVRKQGFKIGAAAALNPVVSDNRYAELFLGGEIGSITTENSLKPQDVQPIEGTFTFDEAEGLVRLAERHNVATHGHALVYDKAMPAWMQELSYDTEADIQRVREVLEAHIKTVVGHFKGRIASWDVVNEAITGFNEEAQLEQNLWFKALGEEYIDIAFRAAHEADPDAKLYINDYGMETNPQGRGARMLDLVHRLQAREVPIHGVGIQGHVYEIPHDTIYPQTLRHLMDMFGGLGLSTRVSELDVTEDNGYEAQADQYASVLQTCLEAPNCTGLTIWGLDDSHGSTAGLQDDKLRLGKALPYTTDYRQKYARRRMLAVLET